MNVYVLYDSSDEEPVMGVFSTAEAAVDHVIEHFGQDDKCVTVYTHGDYRRIELSNMDRIFQVEMYTMRS